MYKIIFLILILFLFSPKVLADVFDKPSNVSSVVKSLPEIKNVSCKFTQEKFIANSAMTLKSGGNFVFDRNNGVIFETLYPVKSTVSYSSNSNKQINRVVNSIINKNYSDLEKNFNIYFEKNSLLWSLGLIPRRETATAEVIDKLKISGNSYIKTIEIKTIGGDITTLNFTCSERQ